VPETFQETIRPPAAQPLPRASTAVQDAVQSPEMRPEPATVRRAPTPEELKQKAIEQILKGI